MKKIITIAALLALCVPACTQKMSSGGKQEPSLAKQHPSTLPKQPPFSIILMRDWHAGTSRRFVAGYSNTFNFIVSKKSEWNIKMLVSPGDCYEETGDNPSLDVTGLKRTIL